MAGWIRKGKALRDDPRIRAIARALHRNDEAGQFRVHPFERYLATALGVVDILWMTADDHVDENDVLALGPDDIEQLTGTQGICQILPADWLVVLDADHVKLPGFHAHNGSEAKRKSGAAARSARYRHAVASRKRDATVTPVTRTHVTRP